jgi:hypothetical protein
MLSIRRDVIIAILGCLLILAGLYSATVDRNSYNNLETVLYNTPTVECAQIKDLSPKSYDLYCK